MKHPSQFDRIHFVTGRLAEPALRKVVTELAGQMGFEYSIDVLPITVAALLNTSWVLPRLQVPDGTQLVVLPGYCQGDMAPLENQLGCEVRRGPRDLRQLPRFFGKTPPPVILDQHDIQIIAEINHAPRLDRSTLCQMATTLREQGADVIDIGCEPGHRWLEVGEAVAAVVDLGMKVSIDSMNPDEIAEAVAAGAQLVLSVNRDTCLAAIDWNAEVVAIPREPRDWESLEETVALLETHRCPFRIDPILEPIGFGFADSLQRYHRARQQWPDVEMMMGVGNLTELTDVDSAGINLLLLGFCQELGIRSVLTTQVINWARTSVQELDIARRLVHYSVQQQVPPKRLSQRLLLLRDGDCRRNEIQELRDLASSITDPNYRIFLTQNQIVCLGGGKFWAADDPFELFQAMVDSGLTNLDPSHSFYLGFEMCKAQTALQLGKNYEQDQALKWGFLTREEPDRHRLRPGKKGASPRK